ncbi:MAG: hypothetical protein AAFX80_06710, partial [Cyanobacteria bacterium J06639_18]
LRSTNYHNIIMFFVRHLIKNRESSSEVIAAPIKAKSVPAGIIELANEKHYDVVVVGASQQGMLSIKQNIPDAIAFGVESTVILVRGAMSYGELHATEVEATSQNSEETSFVKTNMSQEPQQTASLHALPCDQSSESQETELFKNGSSQKSEQAAHLQQSLTKYPIKAGTNQGLEDNN